MAACSEIVRVLTRARSTSGLVRTVRALLPASVNEHFVRAESGLVAHFWTLFDPVSEIKIGQPQLACLLNLPQDAVVAIAGPTGGVVKV